MTKDDDRSLLALRKASFGYGGNIVVRDVDLAIDPGAFYALLGRNGSGKTTLIRGMLGLLRPRSGMIVRGRVDGQPVRLGYVPQRETLDAIFPLSVEEVVAMGTYGRRMMALRLSQEVRMRVRKALTDVGMETASKARFASLSGGQRQRVLLARALAADPHVVLLDEPTSGVDRHAEAGILDLLRSLARDRRLAVLIVSHQLREIGRHVERAFWLRDGSLSSVDAAELLSDESVLGMMT